MLAARPMSIKTDRNFDDLAQKFARKVYGELKGDIRLAVIWRDLLAAVSGLADGSSLRILDIGGGLGQLSIRTAELGHRVIYNDLSVEMLSLAQAEADKAKIKDKITWHQGEYQNLEDQLEGRFDLILCHAMAEWLAQPEQLIARLEAMLAEKGTISLTFYNQHSLVYRNLIRGNFKVLENPFEAHGGSLTPGTPLDPVLVEQWVADAGLHINSNTGIRVFHDYVTTQRGGHRDAASVIEMELRYSLLEPYKAMGRYIHLLINRG